jgi:hypothetical protein
MTMREPDKADDDLDGLFALARGAAPPLPDALSARILSDAETVLAPRTAPVPAARHGWRDLIAVLGGWPAAGGLALATMVGVMIGINPDSGLGALSTGLWGETVQVPLPADADPLALFEG